MDPRRVLVPGVLAVAFGACAGALFHLTISDHARTTVPRGTVLEGLLGDLGFEDLVALDLTASEELQNQGVEPGDVAEVTLVRFDLAAVSPHGADLAFLDTLEVWVSAPDLPDVRVAHGSRFPPGQPEVALELDPVDLTDHVVSRSLTIRTEVRGSRPDEDVVVEARYALRVGVTSQGACGQLRRDE